MAEFDLSNYQRTWKLKQLTEMIHFQADEPGAILRASEVKPKLDRFLVSTGTIVPGDSNKEWYTARQRGGGTDYAFHYKMAFSVEGAGAAPRGDPNVAAGNRTLYLGNMGVNDPQKRRYFVKYPDGFAMTITSKHDEILKKIDEVLPYFFALHGFGARSGKGYGSFELLTGGNGAQLPAFDWKKLAACAPKKTVFHMKYSANRKTPDLTDVWVLSGLMKSGFNFTFRAPGDYYKGRIFRYFASKAPAVGNDKAFIKRQDILPGTDRNHNSEEYVPRYGAFRYVRAMLGLAENYEFRAGPNTARSGLVKISHKDRKIERFHSPVSFRFFRGDILVVPQQIPAKVFDTAFVFQGSHSSKEILTPLNPDLPVPVGCGPEGRFDLIDFLIFFFDQLIKKVDLTGFRDATINQAMQKIPNNPAFIEKIDP